MYFISPATMDIAEENGQVMASGSDFFDPVDDLVNKLGR